MNVLYDHQIFERQIAGGISRYFYELYRNQSDAQLSVKYSDNIYLKKTDLSIFSFSKGTVSQTLCKAPILKKILKKTNYDANKKYKDLNQSSTIENIKNGNYDVFHPTYYDSSFLEYINNKPYVLTIHDMIQEKYPEFFSVADKTIFEKKLLIKKASRIIAISEATKYDIMDVYGIESDKIDVIYHGPSFTDVDENAPICITGGLQKYILYVGTRQNYKNFYFFLLSIETIIKQRGLQLVCVGGPFSREEKSFISNLGMLDNTTCLSPDDNELFALYKNALMFVYPSYAEGFGIPILEAFEAGCPAVLSSIPCFTEVAGDAAIYFNPKKMKDMKYAIDELMQDVTKRNKLIELGRKKVSEYSWEKTVKSTIETYKKAIIS